MMAVGESGQSDRLNASPNESHYLSHSAQLFITRAGEWANSKRHKEVTPLLVFALFASSQADSRLQTLDFPRMIKSLCRGDRAFFSKTNSDQIDLIECYEEADGGSPCPLPILSSEMEEVLISAHRIRAESHHMWTTLDHIMIALLSVFSGTLLDRELASAGLKRQDVFNSIKASTTQSCDSVLSDGEPVITDRLWGRYGLCPILLSSESSLSPSHL
jgi:hypothetical protein